MRGPLRVDSRADEAQSSSTPPRSATARLAALATLAVERYPHTDLLARIWELRDNATAYDAAYLALAEALGAPLFTCDRALAVVPGIRAAVEVARAP